MLKSEVILKVESFLDEIGIPSAKLDNTYTAIAFDMRHLDVENYREVVNELLRLAPPKTFVHTWKSMYAITHIDDQQWPAIPITKYD